MNFQEVQQKAAEMREKYAILEEKRGKVWSRSDIMAGFVGDVGDLSKIIMAKEGLRNIDDIDEKLEHELCDCLWSILVLAHKYDINLEESFQKTMKKLDERIEDEIS